MSSMCPTYTRSRGDIQRLHTRHDLLTDPGVQKLWCDHVDAPTLHEPGELTFDAHELQPWHMTRLKLHQHVNIAVRTEIVTKD